MRVVAGSFLASIILTGCVSQGSYDRLQAQNTQLQEENARLQQSLAAKQGQVQRLAGALNYTIEADLLFPSGSWQLSERGKTTLAELSRKLAPEQRNRIVVNGFTDNTPVGAELEREGIVSNEVLSQRRAEAVRDFLITQGVRPNMISAVGHGESHPVASNDTAAGRAKNRRVELTLGG